MARKIQVNTTDAIGTMVSKLNTMSNYLGDLDDLDSSFKINQFADSPDIGKFDDSSFVKALNHLDYRIDSIDNYLTSGAAVIHTSTLLGDSARFTRLTVGTLIVDSAVFDSASINVLRGGGLRYDSANIDSARITYLSGIHINYDSAEFNAVKAGQLHADSANITTLSGTGTFNYANGHIGNLSTDSAGIINASVQNFDANVANIGQTLSMDGVNMKEVKQFTIKDSAGVILLGGFLLSTDSALGTP